MDDFIANALTLAKDHPYITLFLIACQALFKIPGSGFDRVEACVTRFVTFLHRMRVQWRRLTT